MNSQSCSGGFTSLSLDFTLFGYIANKPRAWFSINGILLGFYSQKQTEFSEPKA